MNRRNFLTIGLAMGFSGVTFGSVFNTDSHTLKITTKFFEDTESLNKRFEKFFSKSQKITFSEMENRLPLKFKVSVFDEKTMLPVLGCTIGIFLSDAFKASGGLSGCSNDFNAVWKKINSTGFIEFNSRAPSPLIKSGKLISPVDFIIAHGDKISVARVGVVGNYDNYTINSGGEIFTKTLTDRALQLTGQSLSQPVAYISPINSCGHYEVAINFIVSLA